jgi:putative oxidoreductase
MRAADVAQLILRLTLAVVIWPHGAQKALGLFGGPGIAGTVAGLGSFAGIPPALAYVVIAIEFLGPIALALGILTRLAALGIAIDMAVAALLIHAKNGFFMNFTGKQAGEGVEFFILIAGVGLALTIAGSGRIAILRKT